MAKVYALINCGWDNFGEAYSEQEHYIGIFTSQELVTKVANDYLKQLSNNVRVYEKEDYMFPETPITFEQLLDEAYEYYKHRDYYGATLYVYEYELDKPDF